MTVPTGTALVVHDLKNALGALEGALAQLVGQPSEAGARAAWRQCTELRHRMVTFLALYGEGGVLRARCDDESPAELLQALQRRHADNPRGIEIGLASLDAAPPFCYLDRRLVDLALDAALHNALRFARARIVLSAAQDGAELVLAVDDDGPGLEPAWSAARPPDACATGLGTALCRAVATAHGSTRADGGIVLANRPAGGARFELRLPT